MGSDGSLRPDRSRFENTLVLFSRMLHGYLDGRISLTEAGSFQNVLKAAAEGCGMHVGEGCWWLADLAETRAYALNNLGYESEDRIGDWQLQTRAEKIQQNSSESAVVLVSRGHFSSFQNTTVSRTNEFSPYSQEQRKKMTKEFKRAQRDLDWDIYASIPDNARVRSESGALYNSVTDYLY